jgi:transposase InsO family protein
MSDELKEFNFKLGHRRIGHLMRGNNIQVIRTRKYKVTTDRDHRFDIAPLLQGRDFHADHANEKWAGDINQIEPGKAESIGPSFSTPIPGARSAQRSATG